MSEPKDFNYLKAPLEPGFRAIEAGAGTGKTYSLIWVVVRLILEQRKQAREILMVTFTEAAALEMRMRLRAILEEALRPNLKGDRPRSCPRRAAAVASSAPWMTSARCR